MVVGYVLDYSIRMSPVGRPLELIAAESDGDALFHVVHHGPGIPGDRLATLFEPLHAVDLDDQSRGTGLGLALAREVTRRHGGDITALSVPDQETRFTLRIPAPGSVAGKDPGRGPAEAGQAPRAA